MPPSDQGEPVASRLRLPEEDGSWTIGRAPTCDIVLNEEEVAEVHAVLKRDAGSLSIIDSGAFAGVYVNGTRINERVIAEGDDIFISPVHLVLDDGDIVYTGRTDRGFRIDALEVNRFVGKRHLVNEVSLSILPGEFVAVVGPSGCGKSTLLSLLSGAVRPSPGMVLYDGEDLYENLEHLRPLIGFVAQIPATRDALTVAEIMQYEASLRLYGKSLEEREEAMERALVTVNLNHRRSTRAGYLSGGERKRLTIALELLSDPKVLWLDEPTSGLDPHLNRHMMQLFRRLSNTGMTVIVVTHDTAELELCDRLVFMVPGGRVAFDGRPDRAIRRFGAADITECYQVAQYSGDVVADQHLMSSPGAALFPRSRRAQTRSQSPFRGVLHQLRVKTQRALRVWVADRKNMWIMLAQAPILALVLSLLVTPHVFTDHSVPARDLVSTNFMMSITVIWLALINASRSFSSEQVLWARERMAGASIGAYVGSKLLLQWALSLYQACALILVMGVARSGFPSAGLFGLPGWCDLIMTLTLTGAAASTFGMVLSAIVSNENRGSSMVPYLVLPQLLMCGLLLELPARIAWVAMGTFSYWSIAAMSSVLDACNHPFVGGPTCGDALHIPLSHEGTTVLAYWSVLAGFTVVGVGLVAAVLTIRDRARHL